MLGVAMGEYQETSDPTNEMKKPKLGKRKILIYAPVPKGCQWFYKTIKIKYEGKEVKIKLSVIALNKQSADKKFKQIIKEINIWDGSQKELEWIIKKYNKYGPPIRII